MDTEDTALLSIARNLFAAKTAHLRGDKLRCKTLFYTIAKQMREYDNEDASEDELEDFAAAAQVLEDYAQSIVVPEERVALEGSDVGSRPESVVEAAAGVPQRPPQQGAPDGPRNAGGDDDECPVKDFKPVEEHVYERVRFEETIGQTAEKEQITRALVQPAIYREAFAAQNRKPENVMLYGPGGTGKTRMVYAAMNVINDAQARLGRPSIPLFAIDSADLKSKYVGVAEKCISYMLGIANRQQSVVFMDEADQIIGAPPGQIDNPTAKIQAKFKDAISDPEFAGNWVMVIITNFPERISDRALVQRFPRRIYVGLPNDQELLRLLTFSLSRKSRQCVSDGSWQEPDDPLDLQLDTVTNAAGGDVLMHRRMLLAILMTHMTARNVNAVAQEVSARSKLGINRIAELRYVKRIDGRFDPIDPAMGNVAGSLSIDELMASGSGAETQICWSSGTYYECVEVLGQTIISADTSKADLTRFYDYAHDNGDITNEKRIERELEWWDAYSAAKAWLLDPDAARDLRDASVVTEMPGYAEFRALMLQW